MSRTEREVCNLRIAQLHLMRDGPHRVRVVAPDHAAYWRDLDTSGYVGGAMADRSGGLITFEARSVEETEQLVARDPVVRTGLLEDAWLKEWTLNSGKPTGRDLRAAAAGPPGR
jgi:uncharacterized protein YciI